MKRWLESRKALMIFLGVVYVILALFGVSAFVKNSVNYRRGLYIDEKGESIISEYMAANNFEGSEEEQRAQARAKAIKEIKVSNDELPIDGRSIITVIPDVFQNDITDIGGNLASIFKFAGDYFPTLKTFSIVYGVLFILALVFAKTDKEYGGIEHGSADWATGGEEYEVLSKKEGFILAKDHFMPMIPNPPSGKNGNILVIRRFWFW